MGLSPEMVNVLKLSDKQFADFANTVNGMSPKVQSNVLGMVTEFNKLWLEIKQVNYEIANLFSSPLSDIFKNINEGLKRNVFTGAGMGIASILDQPFNTHLTDRLKDLNRGWDKRTESVKQYNIRLGLPANYQPGFRDFAEGLVNALEKTLNETEAQMPPSESQSPGQ